MNDWTESILRDETGFGVFDYSRFPQGTSFTVFEEPLNWMKIQIEKMLIGLEGDHHVGQICVRLSSDPSVNAVAIPRAERSILALNAGTCVRLRQLFLFTVDDQEVFPEFSEREHRIGDAETLRFGLSPEVVLQNADLSPKALANTDDDYVHLFGPFPTTRSRFALATSMATAAVDFIAMHEFAHLTRRHAELLPESTSSRLFYEGKGSDRPIVGLKHQLSQLLEIDADIIGAHLSAIKFTSSGTLTEAWRGWAKNPKEALRLWTLSVLMTFHLLDGWSDKTSGRRIHPHPAPRLLTMLSALWERLPEDIQIEEPDSLVAEVVASSRILWARLGLPINRIRPFEKIDLVQDTTLRLIRDYNEKLLPRLRDLEGESIR